MRRDGDTKDVPPGALARTEPSPPGSPVGDHPARLHRRLAPETGGAAADCIPELGVVDPSTFGIAVAAAGGQVHGVGDEAFTIQSASKPFACGCALREPPQAEVMAHVGAEPTGEAFNAIILDDADDRPFNPMVDAGALAVAERIPGETRAARERAVDEDVFRSESETGRRNRAIAWMMLNAGMISRGPEDVLALRFRQCSLTATCRDLAVRAATLANRGVDPISGKAAPGPSQARGVLTATTACGMHDDAGQWAFEVGIPAQSGVSGAILAVIPGQIGLAVWSPPVDAQGAGMRGVAACRAISEDFGLHPLNSAASPRGAIRRVRAPSEDALHVVVDFKRVHDADFAAARLARRMAEGLKDLSAEGARAGMAAEGPLGELRAGLDAPAAAGALHLPQDLDAALEWAEDAILAAEAPRRRGAGAGPDQVRAGAARPVPGSERCGCWKTWCGRWRSRPGRGF